MWKKEGDCAAGDVQNFDQIKSQKMVKYVNKAEQLEGYGGAKFWM